MFESICNLEMCDYYIRYGWKLKNLASYSRPLQNPKEIRFGSLWSRLEDLEYQRRSVCTQESVRSVPTLHWRTAHFSLNFSLEKVVTSQYHQITRGIAFAVGQGCLFGVWVHEHGSLSRHLWEYSLRSAQKIHHLSTSHWTLLSAFCTAHPSRPKTFQFAAFAAVPAQVMWFWFGETHGKLRGIGCCDDWGCGYAMV